MKKTCFLFILLLSSLTSLAYVPLVREGVRWIYFNSDVVVNPHIYSVGEIPYFLEFRGDTIIDGTSYKKLYKSFRRTDDYSDVVPRAFMREVDKKVYIIDNVDYSDRYCSFVGKEQTERLLLDFNDIKGQITQTEWTDYPLDDNAYIEGPFEIEVDGNVVNQYNRYDIYYGGFVPYLVEGIGCMGREAGDFLSPEAFKQRRLIGGPPRPMGLAQQEDLNGRIIYKGCYWHGAQPVQDDADVSTLNYWIDAVLGRVPVRQTMDLNGDYFIDVADINLLIDYILGKK